jgi:hypothetical protein
MITFFRIFILMNFKIVKKTTVVLCNNLDKKIVSEDF